MNATETDGSMKQTISGFLDTAALGRARWAMLLLCGSCLVMDGFDAQAIGYVAPALIDEWHIPTSSLGAVFSAGLFGMFLGSIMFGMLADRIGRRPVIISGTFLFAIFVLAAARAHSVDELLVLRFAAGIGLGSIIPNAMALAGEYSPTRIRVTVMMLVSCGFTAGAALGGLVSALLIPHWGWRSVFYVGGTVPFCIALLMIVFLPESLHFLASVPRHGRRLAATAQRIDGNRRPHLYTSFERSPVASRKNSFRQLFQRQRATATALLWCVNFLNMMTIFFLSNWLSTLSRGVGYPMQTAVLVGAVLQVGGVAGTVVLGRLIDRKGFGLVLTTTFLLAGTSVMSIGFASVLAGLLFACVFLAGFLVLGAQPALNALAAIYYPTHLRTTGVGWAVSIGRLGSVMGPLLGGKLLATHLNMEQVFLCAGLPALVAAALFVRIRKAMAYSASAEMNVASGARRSESAATRPDESAVTRSVP